VKRHEHGVLADFGAEARGHADGTAPRGEGDFALVRKSEARGGLRMDFRDRLRRQLLQLGNSDVLFHPQMLAELLESDHDNALLLSDNDPGPLGDEEMKVKVQDQLVVDISKEMDPLDADGENVGIVKFSASGARLLVEYMDALIGSGELKHWAPRAFLEFARNHALHALSTRGLPWIEIDFPEDYQRAVNEVLPKIEATKRHKRYREDYPAPTVSHSSHPVVTTFDEP
jgi:hypothetical protein